MEKHAPEGVSFPLIMAVARTRALGGVGLGLLLADRLDLETRRVIGAALLAGSIASTIPLLWGIMHRLSGAHAAHHAHEEPHELAHAA